MNFNAKDAKAIRRGTQRPCSATFAQNFATFALKFNDSLRLKLVLTQALKRRATFKRPLRGRELGAIGSTQ
jgi:hypothetical protein